MSDFKDIRTLIVDPAGHSKTLLRSILVNLGASQVFAVSSTEEALLTLRKDSSILFSAMNVLGHADAIITYPFLRGAVKPIADSFRP